MNERALIIGINDYRDVPRLRGCVNDTTNLRLVLKQFAGFGGDQIRMLVDARATKAAIERGLAWLVEGAAPGDLLVLHFSGHGSQVRDRDEQDELRDQLDEILCPWDMAWDGTFISDDYLERVLKVPEGVVLEVILDCCNSGDASAEIGLSPLAEASAPVAVAALDAAPPAGLDAVSPGVPARVPRFLQPPPEIVRRHEGSHLPQRRLLERREPSRLVMWSACADSQTAADARIDDIPNGAFTFFFCKHLREARGQISRAELLGRVKGSLRASGYSQVPELAAPPDFLLEPPFTRRPA